MPRSGPWRSVRDLLMRFTPAQVIHSSNRDLDAVSAPLAFNSDLTHDDAATAAMGFWIRGQTKINAKGLT
jgi:hypothetical protein